MIPLGILRGIFAPIFRGREVHGTRGYPAGSLITARNYLEDRSACDGALGALEEANDEWRSICPLALNETRMRSATA